MATNSDNLKLIVKQAIIKELVERTKTNSIVWNQVAPGQYQASSGPYLFTLNKTGYDITNLDITKDAKPYRTYSSTYNTDVGTLYDVVNLLVATWTHAERIKELGRFMGNLRTGGPGIINVTGSEGTFPLLAGSAADLHHRGDGFVFQPLTMTDNSTDNPWVGTVAGVKGFVDTHNGELNYIRQTGAGVGPKNHGYATFDFDPSAIPYIPAPQRMQLRVVARREVNPNVRLSMTILIDGGIVYDATTGINADYNLYESVIFELTNPAIDRLRVRLGMVTNAPDTLQRAMRITCVNLVFVD